MKRTSFETVVKCYTTFNNRPEVFLAGVGFSVDTNFNRINVICDEDEQWCFTIFTLLRGVSQKCLIILDNMFTIFTLRDL